MNWYKNNTSQNAKKSVADDTYMSAYILEKISDAFSINWDMIIAYKLMEYNYKLSSIQSINQFSKTFYFQKQQPQQPPVLVQQEEAPPAYEDINSAPPAYVNDDE